MNNELLSCICEVHHPVIKGLSNINLNKHALQLYAALKLQAPSYLLFYATCDVN